MIFLTSFAYGHGMSEAEKQSILQKGNFQYLKINASNNALIYAGTFLFLFQMHGYSHTLDPDEFPFPEDSHFHAHEKMDAQVSATGCEYLELSKPEVSDPLDF